MNPALSVVFFTTLAGAGQGLLLAMVAAQWASRLGWSHSPLSNDLAIQASFLAALLAVIGLIASFFHLGRPERAWRAATQWRTSWLSREVIVLPLFIALSLAYGVALATEHPGWADVLGVCAALMAIVLYVCTGMIYACLPFLREWATPLTPINFLLLGCASGWMWASALSAWKLVDGWPFFVMGGLIWTIAAWIGRLSAWRRNAQLAPKSTLQTAIGIKHPVIEQRAQGFMGSSFNTREFFHGRSQSFLVFLRHVTVYGAFVAPLVALALFVAGTLQPESAWLLILITVLQHVGLLAERWLFFAEARHPQNLYYQRMA